MSLLPLTSISYKSFSAHSSSLRDNSRHRMGQARRIVLQGRGDQEGPAAVPSMAPWVAPARICPAKADELNPHLAVTRALNQFCDLLLIALTGT